MDDERNRECDSLVVNIRNMEYGAIPDNRKVTNT